VKHAAVEQGATYIAVGVEEFGDDQAADSPRMVVHLDIARRRTSRLGVFRPYLHDRQDEHKTRCFSVQPNDEDSQLSLPPVAGNLKNNNNI